MKTNFVDTHLDDHNGEHGIALLFALSILSLLLVLTLAFASNSIFDQKTAYNSANVSRARLLAQSAFSKTLFLLSEYNSTEELKSSRRDAITDPNVPSNLTYNNLTSLNTKEGTVNIFEWLDIYRDKIGWEYIKVNSEIIGRYAYVIQPIYALNANDISKEGVNEAATPNYAEKRVGVEANEMNIRSLNETNAAFVALADKFNRVGTGTDPKCPLAGWTDMTTMFSDLGISSNPDLVGKLKKWLVVSNTKSEEYFWRDVIADNKVDTATELFNRFNLSRYLDTVIINKAFDPGETNNWDALGDAWPPSAAGKMYDQILLDTNDDGLPDVTPTSFDSAVPDDGRGIPWLAFFGYDKDGNLQNTVANMATFPNVVDRRRQIAANLVDYCDTNDIPTSNVNPANWGTTAPKFTGNERTPYINEIGVEVNAAIEISKDNPSFTSVKIDFNYRIIGELIDIYESSYTPSVTLQLSEVSVDLEVKCGGSQPSTTMTFTSTPSPIDIVFNSADWHDGYAVGYSAAEVATAPVPYYVELYPPNHNDYITNIKVTKVKFKSAILSDAAKTTAYDYANVIKTPLTGFVPAANNSVAINFDTVTGAGSPITKTTHVAFEAKDPRQNLFPDDWDDGVIKNEKMNAKDVMTLTAASYGLANTNGNPSAAHTANPTTTDAEGTLADPAWTSVGHMSTAYIRNAPMLSPWELGFIHRGQAWQTLNLKEYDKNKAINYFPADVTYTYPRMPGGAAYSDATNGGGDANILDQVKMITPVAPALVSATVCNYKKINLNTTYVDPDTGKNIILQTLFNKITIGSTPNDATTLGTGGATITDLDKLINAVSTRTNNLNYITRAEVANCKLSGNTTNALSDGTCGITQDTDAKQEELIGKFINLTEVSGGAEYFNVIILAQSVKDVGTPSAATDGIDIIKKSSDGATQFEFTKANSNKATRLGTFDYDSGTDIAADEITAEQKIKALIYRDSTGKCKVLRYEYVE